MPSNAPILYFIAKIISLFPKSTNHAKLQIRLVEIPRPSACTTFFSKNIDQLRKSWWSLCKANLRIFLIWDWDWITKIFWNFSRFSIMGIWWNSRNSFFRWPGWPSSLKIYFMREKERSKNGKSGFTEVYVWELWDLWDLRLRIYA